MFLEALEDTTWYAGLLVSPGVGKKKLLFNSPTNVGMFTSYTEGTLND